MQGKFPNADWNSIHTKVDQVLGEDFWQDIAEMIPVLGPRIDVIETEKDVTVYVELPGQPTADHIRISMNGSVLTVRGEVISMYPNRQHNFLLAERFFGSFSRKINLPNLVYRNVRARFNNGLLVIHLTKTDHIIEQTIDIEQD